MQNVFSIIDHMSIKLNSLAWVFLAISPNDVALGFAIAASVSTIAYNWYRYYKDSNTKK